MQTAAYEKARAMVATARGEWAELQRGPVAATAVHVDTDSAGDIYAAGNTLRAFNTAASARAAVRPYPFP